VSPLWRFALGAAAAALIALAALRSRSLTKDGALAAWFVGAVTFGSLGIAGAGILLAFFVTSVTLTRFGQATKRERLVDVAKTGPRDARQVFANGGVAALCAFAAFVAGSSGIGARCVVAFAGAFAAATADTWGTELGSLLASEPRSIFSWRPIPTGLSGGVTAVGTIAEAAGALFIATVALLAGIGSFVAIAVAGFAGALLDSLLGATAQSLRWCPRCSRATEMNPHVCGTPSNLVRGFAWLENDAVNLAASLCGAAIGFVLG